MRVVRLADCAVERWRNGGGDTRELASHSDGGDVIWRISVATIAQDGPFSCFDGMDRSLVRLDGGKLALTIDGRSIAADGEIVAFRGEAVVTAAIDTGDLLAEVTPFDVPPDISFAMVEISFAPES